MINIDEIINKHKPDGPYGLYSPGTIELISKDYAFEILKTVLKDLYKANRSRPGGQDGCVGVREAYGKNLIEIVENYKHQLEE